MSSPSPLKAPQPAKRGVRLAHVLAGAVGFIILLELVALAFNSGNEQFASRLPTPVVLRPTRTATAVPPTETPFPPTMTPIPSETPISPTATRMLPTYAPSPTAPTVTAVATRTPLPPVSSGPTGTPEPTVEPPTETPVPVSLLGRIDISNGDLGTGWILVKYDQNGRDVDALHVRGRDGHTYRMQMGFLPDPEALATTQTFWEYGARGSANWSMIILVHQSVDWPSCPSSANVCYESSTNSGQAVLTAHVYYRDEVWRSLIDDYLAGGVAGVTQNRFYHDIQASVYVPIAKVVPDTPTLSFTFARED